MKPPLRKGSWCRMDPVEKWTTLVDIGRLVPTFVWPRGAPARKPQETRIFLSYSMRLRIALSALMWIRCLRDVQDTIARLRLPYARVSRFVGDVSREATLVAQVFPTRNAERVIDSTSSVSLWISSPTEFLEGCQIPAPHTWSAESSDVYDDTEHETTLRSNTSGVVRRESKRDRLRRVKGLEIRPSADDSKAFQESNFSARRFLKRRRTIARSVRSPLDDHFEADAAFHRNQNRHEGCPLDDDGELFDCPIHIYRSNYLELGSMKDIVHVFIIAHAAVLSCMYIQGRVATLCTDIPEVADYLSTIFEPVVAGGYLKICVEQESMCLPYVPSWCERHAWVAGFGEAIDTANVVFHLRQQQRGGSGTPILVVSSASQKIALTAALEAVNEKWAVFAVGSETAEGIQNALQSFSTISIVSSRNEQHWIDANVPSHIRTVAVNSHTRDALWFFPHAQFLPMKIGNAFRFDGVSRSILQRQFSQRNVCHSVFSEHDLALYEKKCCEEIADNSLLLERVIDHLSNPSKLTLLALFSAKVIGL